TRCADVHCSFLGSGRALSNHNHECSAAAEGLTPLKSDLAPARIAPAGAGQYLAHGDQWLTPLAITCRHSVAGECPGAPGAVPTGIQRRQSPGTSSKKITTAPVPWDIGRGPLID